MLQGATNIAVAILATAAGCFCLARAFAEPRELRAALAWGLSGIPLFGVGMVFGNAVLHPGTCYLAGYGAGVCWTGSIGK